MKKMRWSKFWWQDYERDPALRSCSLAAQGLWMRMLCFMHEGEPHGHLIINGKVPSQQRLASMIGKSLREVSNCLAELNDAGVFSVTDEGVIFSRRLVRDKAASDVGRENGSKGGNPALTDSDNSKGGGGGLTPPFNIQEAEAKTTEEAPPEAPPAAADAPAEPSPTRRADRGSRLPEDWEPDQAAAALAVDLGLSLPEALAEFRDYWRSVPGTKGRKLDWDATFRNRCRERAARSRPQQQITVRQPYRNGFAELARRIAEQDDYLTIDGGSDAITH